MYYLWLSIKLPNFSINPGQDKLTEDGVINVIFKIYPTKLVLFINNITTPSFSFIEML